MFPSARDRRRLRLYTYGLLCVVVVAVFGGILSVCTSNSLRRSTDEAYTELRTVLAQVQAANLEEPADAKQWSESFLTIWLEAGAQNKEILNQWMSEPPPSLDTFRTGQRRVLTVEAVTVDRIAGLWIVDLFAQTAARTENLDGSVSYVAEPMSWWKVTLQKHPETERWWAMFAPRRTAAPRSEPLPVLPLEPVETVIGSSDDPRWEQNAIRWLEAFLVEDIGGDFAFDRLTHPEFKGTVNAEGAAVGGVNDHFLRAHRYEHATVVRMQMRTLNTQMRVCFCEAHGTRANGAQTVGLFPVALVLNDSGEPRVMAVGDDALDIALNYQN